MNSKEEIVKNWLPRYTGMNLEEFGEYILLTNFSKYVDLFAEWNKVPVVGQGKPMQCATAEGISIINFGMGSPTAATIHGPADGHRTQGSSLLGKMWRLEKTQQIG